MDGGQAVEALSALAQEHRLAVFRILVQAGDGGVSAGSLAQRLDVPNSSLSFHLAHLSKAGLVDQKRQGRSILYSANYGAANALIAFLMENCCAGDGVGADAGTTREEEER